ncbi:hypothetical protein FACS1894116_03160 [Betaproteobacteria bacterium]|nr:hypothetical protein FACS1894116_03160 [Betaproteobacteria bacterium]GHU22249.1 hypothetical protein FACS189488_02430 [Betaproteobacteria bacterium]GHU27963.1 hypothetical protein FACS189497_02260 [Betaproteobacteria bacterium]
MSSEIDAMEMEKPEFFGPSLEAWEEAERCRAESLNLLAELFAQGVDVNDGAAELPPAYQERFAAIAARLEEVRPELERMGRERGAGNKASSGVRARARGLRI